MKKNLILLTLVACVIARPNHLFSENGALHKAAEKIRLANEKFVAETSAALNKAGENIHHQNQQFAAKTAEAFRNARENIKNTNEQLAAKTSEAFNNARDNIITTNEKIATKTSDAINNVQENIKTTNEKIARDFEETSERVHNKTEKILKGEEPIVDVAVNTRVKILHSEVGIQGEIKIGGGQTGIHGTADATILGQKANIHADILDIHKQKNENDTHVSVVHKVKKLFDDKLKNKKIEHGVDADYNEYPFSNNLENGIPIDNNAHLDGYSSNYGQSNGYDSTNSYNNNQGKNNLGKTNQVVEEYKVKADTPTVVHNDHIHVLDRR